MKSRSKSRKKAEEQKFAAITSTRVNLYITANGL